MPNSFNPNGPKSQCDGKTKHKTLLSVEYYLENKSGNCNQEYYKCSICDNYHIGCPDKNHKYKSKNREEKEVKKTRIRKFKY